MNDVPYSHPLILHRRRNHPHFPRRGQNQFSEQAILDWWGIRCCQYGWYNIDRGCCPILPVVPTPNTVPTSAMNLLTDEPTDVLVNTTPTSTSPTKVPFATAPINVVSPTLTTENSSPTNCGLFGIFFSGPVVGNAVFSFDYGPSMDVNKKCRTFIYHHTFQRMPERWWSKPIKNK